MELTRRKFFFFGLAAGVGLMLPEVKIKLTNKELHNFNAFYGGNAGGGKSDLINLYGIPYHQSNHSTGTWLGFDRSKF